MQPHHPDTFCGTASLADILYLQAKDNPIDGNQRQVIRWLDDTGGRDFSRADARPAPGRGGKKEERWRRVALEACKQSGRTRIPAVHPPLNLEEALARPTGGVGIVMDPEAPSGMPPAIARKAASAGGAVVAVGPEGGWSDREMEAFREAGFLPVRLGPRILRTETAAIVSTALLQFLAGDLGAAVPLRER